MLVFPDPAPAITSSGAAASTPSPSPQRSCSVRGRYSQFSGSAAKEFSHQAAISQFNGNIDLIDLARNPYLISTGNITRTWMNLKLGIQGTIYTSFNGAAANYDSFGRDAKANGAIFLFLWLAV